MKKNSLIYKILLIAGIAAFINPIIQGIYTISVQSDFTFWEYLLLYSFVYYPTYIIGALVIIYSVYKLKKQ